MTTIAADASSGVMAADSQWTDGTERGDVRKVYRVRSALIGLAGDLDDVREWLRQYKAGSIDKRSPDVSALRLDGLGLQTWTQAEGWLEMPSPWAIGTGGRIARAAMMAGADARGAVRIAIHIDASTNGKVRTYRL